MFTPERALPGLRTSYPKEAVNEVFVNLRMVYGFVRDVRLSGYIRESCSNTHNSDNPFPKSLGSQYIELSECDINQNLQALHLSFP